MQLWEIVFSPIRRDNGRSKIFWFLVTWSVGNFRGSRTAGTIHPVSKLLLMMLQQIASGLNLNDCMAEENFNTELVWLFREVTLCVQNAEKFLTNHDVCKAPYYCCYEMRMAMWRCVVCLFVVYCSGQVECWSSENVRYIFCPKGFARWRWRENGSVSTSNQLPLRVSIYKLESLICINFKERNLTLVFWFSTSTMNIRMKNLYFNLYYYIL